MKHRVRDFMEFGLSVDADSEIFFPRDSFLSFDDSDENENVDGNAEGSLSFLQENTASLSSDYEFFETNLPRVV